MLLLLLLLLLAQLLHDVGGDSFTYIGNGYCVGSVQSGGARPPSYMCEGASSDCDGNGCSCMVENGGSECATVCAADDTCVGFMVQDNSMYGKGVGEVCQIVTGQAPGKDPSGFFSKWKDAKWTRMDGGALNIGGHDTETRDRCYKRTPACALGLPQCSTTPPYATPPATCCLGATASSKTAWVLILLLLAFPFYLLTGTLFRRQRGLAGRHAIPHWQQWLELHALCKDGVMYASGCLGVELGPRARRDSPAQASLLVSGSASSSGGSWQQEVKLSATKRAHSGKPKQKHQRGGKTQTAAVPTEATTPLVHVATTKTPTKAWAPTRTGHLALGARETGVKVSM